MAYGYTFVREGDGYRFFADSGSVADNSSGRSRWSNGIFFLAAGLLVVGMLPGLQVLAGLAVALIVGAFALRARTRSRKVADRAAKMAARTSGFLVTPESITTEGGERIAVARVNRIDVKNEMDAANESFRGSPIRYEAGSGRAVVGAIGHDMRIARTKTRYMITVQHGPSETLLANRLDANGATGLAADIRRVINGCQLD